MSREFFNQIAEKWDEETEHDARIIAGVIDMLPNYSDPQILDVGAGTGVLIPFLKDKFGNGGKIVELDYAEGMIARAKTKYQSNPEIEFVVKDILSYEYPHKVEVIICYSVFPHFQDKAGVLNKLKQGLAAEGRLLIFHSDSREKINAIHQKQKDPAVAEDHLPPAIAVSKQAREAGLKEVAREDSQEAYLLIFQLE